MSTHITLSEALERFLLEDRAEATRTSYRKVLKKAIAFFGPGRAVDAPVREDVLRYVAYLREQSARYTDHPTRPIERGGLSPKTVEKHVKTVVTFFNWLVENGYRLDNPAGHLRLRRYRRPLGVSKAATPAELQAMYRVAMAKAELGRPLHLAVLLFLADTGCRAGEAAALTVGDLLLGEQAAWVNGKGDKTRPVFFGARTTAALAAVLALKPEALAETPLFGLNTDSLSQVINRLAKDAGIARPIGAHAIRHRVGQVWASAKMGEQATQMKLGHDSAAITVEMYYNTTWDHIRQATKTLELAAIFGVPDEPPSLPRSLPLPKKKSEEC